MKLNDISTYNEDLALREFFEFAKTVCVLNEETELYEFAGGKLKQLLQKGKEYVQRAKGGVDDASRKLWASAQTHFHQAGGDNRVVQAVLNHAKKYGKGYIVAAAVLGALAGMTDASAADVDGLFAELEHAPAGHTQVDIYSDHGVGADAAFDIARGEHEAAYGGGLWGGRSLEDVRSFMLHKLQQQFGGNVTADTPIGGGHTLGDMVDWKLQKDFDGGKPFGQAFVDLAHDPHIQKVLGHGG